MRLWKAFKFAMYKMNADILLLLFTIIFLHQEVVSLLPNYCEFSEEIFEYVPKTVVIQQKKERKGKNGILRLLNPRNLFPKNEYENITKTELVVEKRKKVYTTCCHGFTKKGEDCLLAITLPLDSNPTRKTTNFVSLPPFGTSSINVEISPSLTPSENNETELLTITPLTSTKSTLKFIAVPFKVYATQKTANTVSAIAESSILFEEYKSKHVTPVIPVTFRTISLVNDFELTESSQSLPVSKLRVPVDCVATSESIFFPPFVAESFAPLDDSMLSEINSLISTTTMTIPPTFNDNFTSPEPTFKIFSVIEPPPTVAEQIHFEPHNSTSSFFEPLPSSNNSTSHNRPVVVLDSTTSSFPSNDLKSSE